MTINKSQVFTFVGGILGALSSGVTALKKYNFNDANQAGEGIGYILGGMLVGAVLGYFIAKLF